MNPTGKVPRFLQTRDAEDFRLLVEEYQHKVFRLVASVLGPYSDAEAEDVTQEVFLQVHRNAGKFRGDSHFGTWLYAIARNRALDRRKQARFRLPHAGLETVSAMADQASAAGVSEQHDRERMVALAIEGLPEIYRTLLYLYYWQEASIDEIAEYTGIVPGTVKSYLARARHRVEEHLAEHGVHSYE